MSTDATLWALLIEGSDELHAVPSREEAEATAAALNRIPMLREFGCKAKAQPWPYSAESHAEGLKNWEGFK